MANRSMKFISTALLAGATAWTAVYAADTKTASAPPKAAMAQAAMPMSAPMPVASAPTLLLPAAGTSMLPSPAASASAPAMAASGAPMAASAGDAASGVAAAMPPSAAASAAIVTEPSTLDGRIQDAKLDVIKLNRDLLVLEEELLFPANTQVALFVSMDVGQMFDLDSVQIRLDDKLVSSYLYTPREVEALHRGGVQRIYVGNLKVGDHELVAFFTGKGPHERDYKRGATVKFDKTTEPKYIELRINDSTGKMQPEFDVKVWQ